MNCVILTRCSHDVLYIKHFFSLENFDCKIASDFCELGRYARNFVLEFLFIDKDYFNYPTSEDFLRGCLGLLNGHIPIIYIDKNNFTQSISIEDNEGIKNLKPEVKEIFENVIKRIAEYDSVRKVMLRPAEKKLYTLLKNNNEKAISLEEMCLYLWGCSNEGHTKTIYSYINRIKKILDDSVCAIESLQKEKKGFYKIQIKPVEKDCQISPDFLMQ